MFPGLSAVLFLCAFVMEIAKFSLGPVTPFAVVCLGLFFFVLTGVPVVASYMSRRS